MSLNLITDRTQADVDRYYYFRNKRWSDLTVVEKEEFAKGLKGSYNYTDFKRVENAVSYLSNLLNKYGYVNVVKLSAEETFTPEYVRDRKEIVTYLDNIATLQKVYYNSNWVRRLPTIEEWLDYNGANTIEEILANIEILIEGMKQAFVYSGVAGAGQNRIWQQRFRRPISEIEVYTLTNIIPDPSFENNQWNDAVYSTTEKGFGTRSLYFATGTVVVANIEIPRPIVGHKYYGRRYIKSNGDNQPGDSRFEVWGADGENKNWVYAWNRGYHPEWVFNSSIHEIKGVDYAERTIIRCFNAGTTADTWVDGLMLIDLTECFGAGKEPNVFWCDRNIPYFEGTKTIEVKKPIGLNYKVFGNAEQATRSAKNLLIKNGLSTPLTDSTFWHNASATTVLEDGWCRIELDNTSGTGEKYANQFTKINTIDNIVAGETYSIYYEIRNISSTNGNFYLNLLGDETPTIWASSIYVAGFNNKEGKYIYTRKTKSDLTGKTMSMRNFVAVSAGNKLTLEYRMMIVKGSYTLDTIGDYEPYGVMPSPNYPSEVYGLGRNGAIGLKQKIGENCIDTVARTVTGMTVKRNSDGTITINGTLDKFTAVDIMNQSRTYFKKGIYSIIVENDGGKPTSGDFYYYYRSKNAERIYLWKNDIKVKTYEFTDDVRFSSFDLYLNAGVYNNVTYKFQIVKGSEYKPYIPFIEVNKYIAFTNHEPLMKVGDVEDVIDYEKGKILRRIGKAVFDGSSDENWTMTYGTGLFDNQSAGLNFTTNNALCSHFIFNKVTTGMNAGLKDGEFAFQPQYDNRPIFFKNLAFTNVTDWRNWLTNNPITVWYELAEPYYEEIDLPSIQKIPGEYSLTAYDEYLDGRVEKE